MQAVTAKKYTPSSMAPSPSMLPDGPKSAALFSESIAAFKLAKLCRCRYVVTFGGA